MEYTNNEIAQIKKGRSKFIAMATTYCLGVFNDNFFKQAASLIAVSIGFSHLQGVAIIALSLPFILFSAYAGWFADKYSKRTIVIAAKLLELFAMLIGAFGILTINWYCIIGMVFTMGFQSTIFGPALNGSIPELYPEKYVVKANALLKLVTSVSILIGVAISGWALDRNWIETVKPFGYYLVAAISVLAALLGVIISFGLAKIKPANSNAPFPWSGPVMSVKDIIGFKEDFPLITAILCSTFFYFISSTVVAVLNKLGIQQLLLSKTNTSYLPVALMIGVSIGAFIAAKLTAKYDWKKLLFPSVFILGCGLVATGGVVYIPEINLGVFVFAFLVVTGVAGGVFLIPITSFIQTHPHADDRGRTIAASNFIDFIGIIIGGMIYSAFDSLIQPAIAIVILGLSAICFSVILFKVEKQHA